MATVTDSEVLFGPGRKKGLMLLAASSAFVALGVLMRHDEPLVGWASICFFGLGIPISISLLLPGFTYLKLDRHGFEVCALGRKHKTAWSDVKDLQMISVQGSQMIGFNYAPGCVRHKAGRAVASALSGVEGAVPSHYNVRASELLEIMLAWHSRYAKPAI